MPEIETYALPEPAVAAGAAEPLNPAVLIRGHGLARQLAADPVGLLGKDHLFAHPGGGERRGATAGTAPQDDNVCLKLSYYKSLS
jgi:hypothetical protein